MFPLCHALRFWHVLLSPRTAREKHAKTHQGHLRDAAGVVAARLVPRHLSAPPRGPFPEQCANTSAKWNTGRSMTQLRSTSFRTFTPSSGGGCLEQRRPGPGCAALLRAAFRASHSRCFRARAAKSARQSGAAALSARAAASAALSAMAGKSRQQCAAQASRLQRLGYG